MRLTRSICADKDIQTGRELQSTYVKACEIFNVKLLNHGVILNFQPIKSSKIIGRFTPSANNFLAVAWGYGKLAGL